MTMTMAPAMDEAARKPATNAAPPVALPRSQSPPAESPLVLMAPELTPEEQRKRLKAREYVRRVYEKKKVLRMAQSVCDSMAGC
ncbi:hypothetical protein PINS_up003406 [Pythium insidiosum]|nr:hypothetical protein PINS_up003406 [Pythium insidiosum]